MEEYVSCLECGHKAKSLARHIRPVHNMTAEDYREKHPGALIRSPAAESRRREGIQKSRQAPSYGGTKLGVCPSCGETHEVSKFSIPTLCAACRAKSEEVRWEGLSEPEDYVTCKACGYRAENLTSHIQIAHPDYRTCYPDASWNALGSGVRDKSKLQGRKLSSETRKKMSQNAGRWNRGLTKDQHPSLASQSQKMRGKPSWNEGLTAQTSDILRKQGEKLRLYIGENRPWNNGLRADLTLQDFAPVLDEHGRVDRKKAMEVIGFSWNTISKYLCDHGLEVSGVNIRARAEARIIRLTPEQLLPYTLKNGKLVAAWAASRLGVGADIVSREADRHGIPKFQWGLSQGLCLGTVSEALGGADWIDEWRDTRYTNPETGHRYKFDGYFPEHGLVVEYHGHQHFIWPNAFYKTEEEYLALRRRDQHKRDLILGDPDLKYLEIRFDEPFDNVMYIRGRLANLGV